MTDAVVIDDPRTLVDALLERGLRVIGPKESDGVIVHDTYGSSEDLPRGRTDRQSPGSYRLEEGDPERWFDYVVGPGSWKAWLYPAKRRLWRATSNKGELRFEDDPADWIETAFFGVRPCDLSAIGRQRDILVNGPFADPDYGRRMSRTLIVVVQCARSASTCFCASMGTGPRAGEGFDLAITELGADGNHRFLVECGSDAGADVLDTLGAAEATENDLGSARRVSEQAALAQQRRMPDNVAEGLKLRPDADAWDDVSARCLNCANCTLACPTCFCSDVEDVSDLSGETAERWRHWASCFDPDFSYIHGGPVRRSSKSRYRQWMTHKLSYWHDQFGTSGCVGCGRCITWCPVGIDIVAEAGAVMASSAE